MPELPEIVNRARSLVPAIAADLEGFGGTLRCTVNPDHAAGDLDADMIAYYLRKGWPKCCGYTMRWVTQRELDEEARDA